MGSEHMQRDPIQDNSTRDDGWVMQKNVS